MTGQIQLNTTIFIECNGNNVVTAVLILTLLFDYKYFSLNAAKHLHMQRDAMGRYLRRHD